MFKGIADLNFCHNLLIFLMSFILRSFSSLAHIHLEDCFQCLYYKEWGLKLSSFKNIPKVNNFFHYIPSS